MIRASSQAEVGSTVKDHDDFYISHEGTAIQHSAIVEVEEHHSRNQEVEVNEFYIPDEENEMQDDIAPHASEKTESADGSEGRGNRAMYAQKLTSTLTDPRELSIYEKGLEKATCEAGEYAYGIVAVEVWVFDRESGFLYNPKSGWWLSAAYAASVDCQKLDQVTAEPVIPGADLAGVLWSRVTRSNHHEDLHELNGGRSFRRMRNRSSELLSRLSAASEALTWNELSSFIDDPDTLTAPRLQTLAEAGLRHVTSIDFNALGYKGLVLFFPSPDADADVLSTSASVAYLRASASNIGSCVAVSEARRALDNLGRGRSFHDETEHFLEKNSENSAQAFEKSKVDGVDVSARSVTTCESALRRFKLWGRKCLGGNMQIPPGLSFVQSLWTVVGAFCSLLILSGLNEYVLDISNRDYYLLLGPFGALMTLQYGLSSAPASQPRNVVLGQIVAGAVSLAFTYVPDSILPTWLRRAVGPACAIGAMVKLGITHPPAGAHSVIYASGEYNWTFYAIVVLGSAISVLPATTINNMSVARQHPSYWGYLASYVSKKFPKKEVESDD